MRASREWAIVAVLLVGAGVVLRWWHLSAVSIWWDELVQIRSASQESIWRVIQLVRLGVPPGSGNAGAVPLDYVLLHLWMRVVPQPGPEWLEIYFRAPSCLASCAMLAVLTRWTWRTFGPGERLATTVLTAASIPLLLYAGEARFYSLFLLFTVLNLVAFTTVVRDTTRSGAWLWYAVTSLGLVLSGIFGLLILPWQLLTLLAVTWRDPAKRRRATTLLGAIVIALGCVLAAYYVPTDLATRSVRRGSGLPTWQTVRMAFGFFGMGSPWLPIALALGPLAALVHVWRRERELLPVLLCTIVVVLTALPVILQIAQWKQHFFHPRHALFLLPPLLLLLGVGIAGLADMLLRGWTRGRDVIVPGVALALALALATTSATRYVNAPAAYFRYSKTPGDMRGVVRTLRQRTSEYGPDDRYLLIATRGQGAYLGNPVLAQYLDWYGIGDRVVLRSTVRPAETLAQVREMCWTSCWVHGHLVDFMLQLQAPFQLLRAKRRLLGRRTPRILWPGRPQHIGFALYTPLARWKLGDTRGYRTQRFAGLHLFELDRPPFEDTR